MSLDEIRIATLALHGALSAADRAGSYRDSIGYLKTAAQLVGEADGQVPPYHVDPNLTVPELIQLLTVLERELRDLTLTTPAMAAKGMVALPSIADRPSRRHRRIRGGGMTPAAIEWRQRKVAQWSARAAELRATSDAGAQQRALGLEWVVAGMQREIGAAAPVEAAPTSEEDERHEALRRQIAAIQSRFDASLGVTVNDGPIMDAVRARLQARLDGVAFVPASHPLDGARTILPAATIPAEVIPFIVGPQLGLFGDAL